VFGLILSLLFLSLSKEVRSGQVIKYKVQSLLFLSLRLPSEILTNFC